MHVQLHPIGGQRREQSGRHVRGAAAKQCFAPLEHLMAVQIVHSIASGGHDRALNRTRRPSSSVSPPLAHLEKRQLRQVEDDIARDGAQSRSEREGHAFG